MRTRTRFCDEMEQSMIECGICLQAFEEAEEGDRVPRVLACGHTLCQGCIHKLAQRAEHYASFLLRCAECAHLSRFVSPKSLPRNIELLRLSDRRQSKPQITVRQGHFPAEERGFFVLEDLGLFSGTGIQDCVVAAAESDSARDSAGLVYGNLRFISEITGEESRFSVSLLALGSSTNEDGITRLEHRKASYTASALKVWAGLRRALKKEVLVLSRLASVASRVCKVLGFWMSEHRELYLVNSTDVDGRSLSKYVNEEEADHGCYLAFKSKVDAGLQLCEVLMELHGAGVCSGLFDAEVFVEDVFGRLYFHWNGASQRQRTMNRAGDLCWQYLSPEMLEALSSSDDCSMVVDASSDAWSVALFLLQVFFKLPVQPITFEKAYAGRFQREADARKELEVLNVSLPKQELVELKELLLKCIAYTVEKRGNVKDIWEFLKRLAFFTFNCGCSDLKPIHCPSQDAKVAWCIGIQDVNCVSGSDDLVSGSPLQDTVTGKLLRTLEGGHTDVITCLTISGSYLVSTSYDKTVRVWTLEDGLQVWIWEGYHLQRIVAAVSDPSTQVCFTGDYGGRICAWRISAPFSSQPICSWKEHDDWRFSGVAALALSSNGILYSGSGDRTIKAWSTESEEYQHLATLDGHTSVVSALAIDGELLYSGSWDGSIRIWLLSDHSPVAVLKGGGSGVIRGLAVIGHSNIVMSFGDGILLQVWENCHFLGSRKVHDSVVSSMTLAQGMLITGSLDSIHFWHLDQVLTEDAAPVTSISLDTAQKDISFVTALAAPQGQLVAAISTQIKVFQL